MGTKQVPTLQAEWTQGVMALKWYSTFPEAQRLKIQLKMRFTAISRHFFGGDLILLPWCSRSWLGYLPYLYSRYKWHVFKSLLSLNDQFFISLDCHAEQFSFVASFRALRRLLGSLPLLNRYKLSKRSGTWNIELWVKFTCFSCLKYRVFLCIDITFYRFQLF